MIVDIQMKKGDRLPSIERVLRAPDDTPVDLTGASGVVFKFQLATTPPGAVISGSCVIVDALNGRVRYDWGASDTAVGGTYRAEFIATIGGKEETFPNKGFLVLVVDQEVA